MKFSKTVSYFLVLFLCVTTNLWADTVVIYPDITYQTITGWETMFGYDLELGTLTDEILDQVTNDLGINRVRLEIRAGVENDTDYWTLYRTGKVPYQTWRSHRYANVNDNNDPDVINQDGFHFSEMDLTINTYVLPLKQRIEAKGEDLYINLCYVAFTSQNMAGTRYIHDDPDEYAEFMLATFNHLQSKYGWVPDGLEIILEPDNVSQWGQLALYVLDNSDSDNPVFTIGEKTKFTRQYYKFIRPGAVRIKAVLSARFGTVLSSSSTFDPLAFINANGKYVVVVKTDADGSFTIVGLPPGTYGIKYTTFSEYDRDLPDQSIDSGESLTTSIPGAGVLTLYQKCGTINGKLSDLNEDGTTNFEDLAILADYWMDCICLEPYWCDCSDFDQSGSVDFYDFAQLGSHWGAHYVRK